MMPNAWFYKLKDMSVIKRNQCRAPKPFPQQLPPQASNQMFTPSRASYYLSSKRRDEETLPSSPIHPKGSDTHFPLLDPPRKSKRKPRRKTSTVIKPSTNLVTSSMSTTCSCRANSPAKSSAAALQEFDLAPCSTKPARERTSIKPRQQEKCSRSPRPSRLKLHVMNSPRLRVMSRKSSAMQQPQQQHHQYRKSISQSLAIVKASSNPQKDFRDSMVEMIVENNIRTPKDLEDLLACYLSLNSEEYHDVIVKVFEQIWFDLTDIRLSTT
ncbi:hypothetical protein J5N97_017470 [Dioscorea zingiberensis]|uniref:Transcription repressor n=1 Tax=Dioscorea zingiberensis TaxID=325984 RepID=A0A9D5CP50_9LILI|nr:hypothetical protein J5N97_017470 [Dioscorea zingiberensis]